MTKKVIGMRMIAYILVITLFFINCYPSEVFAANNKTNSNNSNNSNTTEKVKYQKKNKSNQKIDIIVKYKDISKKEKTINNAKNKSKASKLDQKRYFGKQKIGVYEISASDNRDAVIEELNSDPNVEYAQPNYPLSIESVIPTDSKLIDQWSLYNDGQSVKGVDGRATVDINVINAWGKTMGSNDVIVGVLDSGIDITHPDLKNNIYINQKEIKNNGIDDDGNGYIDDINGWDFSNDDLSVYDSLSADTHGTYIAGIIAASANDGGVVGVAPNVRILPLKFINGTTGYTSDAIEAIEYAKSLGVKIMNCSFGGTDDNLALKDAMQNSGMLFICSAGNGGNDTAVKNVYPAGFNLSNIISVTAIDSNGVLPSFSNYGTNVDVAAPGTSILSTTPDEGYDYYSGTSAAAAVVSGIAALAKSEIPNISISDIKNQITNNVTPCTNLTGKVASGGRVDAFGTLSGTVQPIDVYNGSGNNSDVLPTEGDGEADTWYIMDERASNVERFHYGEGGVNPASGNYSVTCTDMSMSAPGFMVNISRSYNSRNTKQTLLGKGWTFGFEGTVVNKGSEIEVNLPNGSSHVFHLKGGIYVGEGTRANLVKNEDKSFVLITQDQYKYGFDPSTYKMTYMEDKNGNKIKLDYESGKLVKITDTVGRIFTLTYNGKNLLTTVTDPDNRIVSYAYNSSNLLTEVTDPQGGSLLYEYDSSGYLKTLIDQNNKTFQQLTYSHNYGDTQNKVIKTTDAAGETWSYSYDVNKRSTTITNNSSKKWTYWFDAAMFTTRVQDPEGKSTYTEYTYKDSNTYYGDVQTSIDRNGNRTEYEVNLTTGNILKITQPDGGIKTNLFDKWNNVIEVNDNGRKTYYIYDEEGKNLLKEVKPLDGVSDYVDGDTTSFAVTTNIYYSRNEAASLFNCEVAGLLKSTTDPAGKTTTYTYDRYGNTASVAVSGTKVIYTYDKLGNKLTETTLEGNVTQYFYDSNNLLIKVINPDEGVKRTVYTKTGKVDFEVEPNQYDATKDIEGVYTGKASTDYEWYEDTGYLKYVTDAEGNRTKYTWDIFGNKATETKPNGAIYRYEYDSLNRLTKTYFKESSTSTEVLLSEISYAILINGTTQTNTIMYADDTQKTTMLSIKDYAGREIMNQYGDYSRTIVDYNLDGTINQSIAANGAVTYYKYDELSRLKNKWEPVSIENGKTLYSWTGYTYDKAGNKLAETTGKSLVALYATTEDVYTKNYFYTNGLLMSQTDSEGRSTTYQYDKEGRVKQETKQVDTSKTQSTEYRYNYRGQKTSISTKVRKGDIAGNNYSDNGIAEVETTYNYDLNGNLEEEKDVAGYVTEYTYDKLNRVLTTKKELKDTNGTHLADVVTSKTYTWDGQVASETDARGNVTTYAYDKAGNQTKVITGKDQTNVTYKVYDRLGRNTAIVSAKNYKAGMLLNEMQRTEFTYDVMNRVVKQTEVYQKMFLDAAYEWKNEWVSIVSKSLSYDTLGNVTSETDALGNTTEKEYNLAGKLEQVIDPETKEEGLAYTVKYNYNGLGQKVNENYPGAKYSYTYDGMGNLLSTFVNGTFKASSTYDKLGRMISSTNANGNTTTNEWNGFSKVSKSVVPGDATIDANQTIYQYDLMGNQVYSKDSLGKTITNTYDNFSRMLSQTTGDSNSSAKITTSTSYDLNGNTKSVTDGRGNVTTYTYDELNRKSSMTNARQQTTKYQYDANSNLISEENYLGNTIINTYDGINRLVEKKDALGNVVQQILYNDANAQVYSYDALHNKIEFLYDKNMRQTGTIDGEGFLSKSSYDSRGNIKTKTDANQNKTTYTYDSENRLVKVKDAGGNTTMYSYDMVGNLIAQTNGNGDTTTYRYNAANLVVTKRDPEDSTKPETAEQYTYDANGLMKTKTDRNGILTVYEYDIFGRLLTEDVGGEIQSYTYDANGNQLTMTDASGTTVRTFDKLNRVSSKTVPYIGKSTYTYDLPVEGTRQYVETTTDPKGNYTEKTYDEVGRLSKVTVGEETTTYQYLANGTKEKVIYPDGTKETYSYDRKNQVTSLVNAKADGTVLSHFDYTYDNVGNQLTKTQKNGTTSYTYDSLNRLNIVTEPDGKVTEYTYDGAGNRKTELVKKGSAVSVTTYSYNNQNRLMATISTGGIFTNYVYDKNGNLTSKMSGKKELLNPGDILQPVDLPNYGLIIKKGSSNGTGVEEVTLYNYNHYNRLISTKSKNCSAYYKYNAQGYRVEKIVNGDTTRYLYDVDKVVLETDDNNNQKAVQVYGSSLLYRSIAADESFDAQSYYYLYNAHGDVTELIDAEGKVAVSYDYDAFGTLISKTGDANNAIRYAGYQYDEESGLYYLNARYYDSVTARFITEDTYTGEKNDPLSLNLYAYCHNNPIIYDDPSGHVISVVAKQTDSGGSSVNTNNTTQGTGNTNKTGYTITAKSTNCVDVNYPNISSWQAFILGFDSYSGGIIIGGINIFKWINGKQIINQDVIDYNKKYSSEFKDKYNTGQAVAVISIIGSIATAVTAKGASQGGKGTGDIKYKYNFADQKKFDKHYDKHVIKQGEFGDITKDQYLLKANNFANSSGSNVLTRTASNGDVLKFNPSTNEFSIVTKDGVFRTYHKLDPSVHGKGTNMDYWKGPDCNY